MIAAPAPHKAKSPAASFPSARCRPATQCHRAPATPNLACSCASKPQYLSRAPAAPANRTQLGTPARPKGQHQPPDALDLGHHATSSFNPEICARKDGSRQTQTWSPQVVHGGRALPGRQEVSSAAFYATVPAETFSPATPLKQGDRQRQRQSML